MVGDEQISYTELLSRTTQFSNQYIIAPQDRVVILSENRTGWVYAFYSIWAHEGIPVPIDFLSSYEEVAYIINDSMPAVVWVSKERYAILIEALKMCRRQPQVLLIDDFEKKSLGNEVPAQIGYEEQNTALIIYTSGTTGSPKGVMLSFKNILVNIKAIAVDFRIYHEGQRTLMLLPLHHILPLLGSMVMPLHTGGSIGIAPSMASADILNTLQKCRITIVIGVPRLYAAIYKGVSDKIALSAVARGLFWTAKKLDNAGFSRFVFKSVHQKFGGAINFLVSGGASLDPEVGDGFKALGFEILEGYGMTEAAPMISFTRPGKVKIGATGLPLPGIKIDFVDGEIIAKGENIMQGYYNKPAETAQVIKDGWLYTGDLGHLDEEGNLVITGRKKEIIVLSNGKNINPSEIEDSLCRHSEFIKEIGIYQDKDQLKAIIVPADALCKSFTNAEIEGAIRTQVIVPYNNSVAPYKKVANFSLYEQQLPRTRLGKLQRFKLAELKDDTAKSKVPEVEPNTDEYKIIKNFIENEKNCTLNPSDHIEMDLGFDSLDKVGLQVFLQSTFGIDLEMEKIVAFQSVETMSAWVAEYRTRMEVERVDWKRILKEKVSLPLPRTWFTGRLFVKLSKFIFTLYFGLKAKGQDRIPDGPVILAPNHQSFFDGLFVASFLKNRTIKNTYFYAKDQHVKQGWLRFMANRHNVIVMDLNNLKDSIQKMGEALKSKKNLIIFPEGTRTVNGKLGEFKRTFAILSKELNIPIVPVSIKGAYEALPKGSFFPKPFRKVRVEFLDPIYPNKNSYETIALDVQRSIESNMRSAI